MHMEMTVQLPAGDEMAVMEGRLAWWYRLGRCFLLLVLPKGVCCVGGGERGERHACRTFPVYTEQVLYRV